MSTALRTYFRGSDLVSMKDELSGDRKFYHLDNIHSVQALTDRAGAITDRSSTDGWGVSVRRTGVSSNKQWYRGGNGYYQSSRVELDYASPGHLGTAYLGAPIGRWLSLNTVQQYSYLSNNPTRSPAPINPALNLVAAPMPQPIVEGYDCSGAANLGATTTCTQICQTAWDEGIVPNTSGGSIVCDGARRCACVTLLPIYYQCPWVIACQVAHEVEHCGQHAIPCDECKPIHWPLYPDKETDRQSECAAFRAQLDCLNNALNLPGLSIPCKVMIPSWINTVQLVLKNLKC